MNGDSLPKIFKELYEAKNFYEREATKEIKVRAKFTKKPDADNFKKSSKSRKARSRRSRAPSKISAGGSMLGSSMGDLDDMVPLSTPGKSRQGAPQTPKNVLFSIKEEGNKNGENQQ